MRMEEDVQEMKPGLQGKGGGGLDGGPRATAPRGPTQEERRAESSREWPGTATQLGGS